MVISHHVGAVEGSEEARSLALKANPHPKAVVIVALEERAVVVRLGLRQRLGVVELRHESALVLHLHRLWQQAQQLPAEAKGRASEAPRPTRRLAGVAARSGEIGRDRARTHLAHKGERLRAEGQEDEHLGPGEALVSRLRRREDEEEGVEGIM